MSVGGLSALHQADGVFAGDGVDISFVVIFRDSYFCFIFGLYSMLADLHKQSPVCAAYRLRYPACSRVSGGDLDICRWLLFGGSLPLL